jgi:hypothetical protein
VKSANFAQKCYKICQKGPQGSIMCQNRLKKPKKSMKEPQGCQKASKIAKNGPKSAKKSSTIGKTLQLIEKHFKNSVKNESRHKN